MSESSSLLPPPPPAGPDAPKATMRDNIKKLYKAGTRVGIGGKLKDADPLVVWFLGLAFTLPALILVLLPLFECTLFTCDPEDGSISISSVIEDLPLATVYAVMASVTITILCYYQLIICKRGWKIVFAIFGYLCLLVPLMLPLSVESDVIYHDIFAAAGFLSEVIFVCLVFIDIAFWSPVPPNGTTVVYICAFASVFAVLLFIVGWIVGTDDANFDLVYQIIAEYLIGLSALALVKVLEYFEIYPIPHQFDECWPWAIRKDDGVRLEGGGGIGGAGSMMSGDQDPDDFPIRDTNA